MLKSWLAPNPVDRPILAKIALDPLFRKFITLKPYNKRTTVNGINADHNGFKIGSSTFAGERSYESGQVNIAILVDMKLMTG